MSKITFSFGKNWQSFLKHLTEERIRTAEVSILEFIGTKDLSGKSFLDAGCGSGLFSFCAFRLGASPIVSFDYDPFSVRCCQYMREKAGNSSHWQIHQGSVLDREFLRRLGDFDIVYSWGVLHHTGNMWEAIQNSAHMVKGGGLYFIALYNKSEGALGSRFWLRIKKIYNAMPPSGKYIMEWLYVGAFFIAELIKFKNPFSTIRSYRKDRGMEWFTDVRDWLGGYPFEFATVKEVNEFMHKRFPHFALVRTIENNHPLGMNWFLYKNDVR